jgi:CheY-like chemotaxis protein
MVRSPPCRAKKRILFVDDEPGILLGLERLLWRDRPRWEMVFVLGGQRALDELRGAAFDVVVSDLRMADVDGATLLLRIHSDSPATVRILLTGYADDTDLGRARPALDRLLAKPCSAAVLREAIEGSLAERQGAER